MERRTVRIYKAPNGQGEYINKTKKFLQKAQMGAETTSENVMAQKQMEALKQYVTGALSNDMDPEEVYKLLISKGVPKEIAYPILTQVMQEIEAPEDEEQLEEEQGKAEESKIGQTEYQPVEEQPTEEEEETDSAMNYYNSYSNEEEPDVIANSEAEFQDGGIISYDQLNSDDESEDNSLEEKLATLANFVQKTSDDDDFSDFGKDISEYTADYTPIEWDTLNDGYGYYKHGGSKKNFTKNVLALIKKQEGGDAEESKTIGQGNKKDTLTNDVSKIKSQFTDKLKEVSSKAAIDSIYEKMMGSNNPELIQQAQELAQNRQKNSQMGSFEPVAQQGGYIGENQPEMFSYGGFDIPEAQKGIINKLGDAILGKRYYTANNPYDVKTGAMYKDPVSGLTPVARTVHKRGIFGRPKQWTDYYQKGPSKVDQDFINNFAGNNKPKNTKAAKLINTLGENKQAKAHPFNMSDDQWNKLSVRDKMREHKWSRMAENDQKFKKGIDKFIDLDEEARKQKQSDLQIASKDADRWSTNIGMDNPEWWANATKKETEQPVGLTSDDIAMLNAEQAAREAEELKLERINSIPALEGQENALLKLENYYDDSFENANDIRNIKNDANKQFNKVKDFRPDSKCPKGYVWNGVSCVVPIAGFKSSKDQTNDFMKHYMKTHFNTKNDNVSNQYEYGGILEKAQMGVKSPTNGISTASDPTATSGNLINMLKPQNNPNTLLGASAPFMNQNTPANPDAGKVKTVEMDPNQTQDQTVTSLDFGNPDNDNLVAQDVQRKREFDGIAFNNKLNAAADMFTGFMGRLDSAKKEKEMYQNNFSSDSLYGVSTNKDRGDYVAYGQQTGMFRPDETGQETSGRFAYGQSGGYMQDGGYVEGDEVDMTPEELEAFLANGGEVEYLES